MSSHCPAEEIITVPGAKTSPSWYFCFIDNESFPVGILIPRSMAKSEQAFTASYNRSFSPGLLHGHIQLADRLTDLIPSDIGAHTIFVNDSAIALTLPFAGLISPIIGA